MLEDSGFPEGKLNHDVISIQKLFELIGFSNLSRQAIDLLSNKNPKKTERQTLMQNVAYLPHAELVKIASNPPNELISLGSFYPINLKKIFRETYDEEFCFLSNLGFFFD